MSSKSDIQHTGQEPSRRPPDDEPERVGEGELGSDGPAVGSIQVRDEDYAVEGREIPGDSEASKALHQNRRPGEGQLTTGSGGDAARPGQEGIFNKPIPPRENV